MKRWRWKYPLGLVALGFLMACSISDADRCPSGFTYDPALKACQTIPDAATVSVDTALLPSADSGAAEVEGVTFGSVCKAAGDCVSATTDYCVALPGAGSGYCSKAQCTSECPTTYRCCNCAAFSLVVCLKATDATQATAAFGCTCS